jgi:hypothetical protein
VSRRRANSTRTVSKARCRLPPSRPSSSRRCWRPSTTSLIPYTRSIADQARTIRIAVAGRREQPRCQHGGCGGCPVRSRKGLQN